MPYANEKSAVDACLGLIRAVTDALEDERKIDRTIWQAVPASLPSGDKTWVKVLLIHTGGEVGNLGASGGRRRYNRSATLTVQIFEPSGKGRAIAYDITPRIQAAIQGKTDAEALVFRGVSPPIEAGTDGSWDQTNMTATVEYDVFA